MKKIIAFEGFDGSGKSSLAKKTAEYFGYEYHKSPSENFALTRNIFDEKKCPVRERMAFYIADCIRISLMMEELSTQKFVLDRYFYSTLAYHEAKYPGSTVQLKNICTQIVKPDLVFLINCNYSTLKNRIEQRNENLSTDELFLSEDLVEKIYNNYRKFIDVPIIENDNNEHIDSAIEQISKYLK
jgi:thymidylate kinase